MMKKTQLQLSEIKLVGIKERTNKKTECSANDGKIGKTIERYFGQQLPEKIPYRKTPGTTFCVYTEYESDHNGDYTFFVGEEVSEFKDIPEGLEILTIPSQSYTKFTTESGKMPNVVINAWQRIWQMSDEDFGGERRYLADFEVYDKRAQDRENTALDIYIGIKK